MKVFQRLAFGWRGEVCRKVVNMDKDRNYIKIEARKRGVKNECLQEYKNFLYFA